MMEATLGNLANAYPHARQLFEETPEEKEFRIANKFPEVESAMPTITSRRRASLIDIFTSWLGEKNPHSHPVDENNHAVWLFDNTAYRVPGGTEDDWEAEYVAAYFIKNSGKDVSSIAADLAEKLGIGKGDEQEKTIAERLQPLVDSILPAHTVQAKVGKNEETTLGPSDRNGISSQTIRFRSKHSDGESSMHEALGVKDCTPCRTTYAEETGWAIISDIDDTIKLTMTASPYGILKTTFAEPFRPIEGMPELYKHLQQRLSGAPFWYLSASPYNLYPFLHEFREQYYPSGSLILRDASWMNLGGFLASLTQGVQAYKVSRMEKIHTWFPRRRFLCFGDTTQSDPESYGEMHRRYPDWVGGIFIRKVTGVAEMDESKKNSDERLEKAFEGVPRDVWYAFEDPQEVYEKADKILNASDSSQTDS